jgi:hypothetical protein
MAVYRLAAEIQFALSRGSAGMDWWWLVAAAALVGTGLLAWSWRPLRRFGREVQAERARELFRLQRERLEGQFLSAAAATGKPRGLRWKDCAFETALELARDKHSGQIVALVPVTIQFEAIEGGDMEGWHAVAIPRNASAVFFFERGQWSTVGKAVFNMNPDEALEHFRNQYERVDGQSRT